MTDEHDIVAKGLADLMERWHQKRAGKACMHCGRPNTVCDQDYCSERLKHICHVCRAPGIFHKNDCPNLRARGTDDCR
jgi:hypothetical protein